MLGAVQDPDCLEQPPHMGRLFVLITSPSSQSCASGAKPAALATETFHILPVPSARDCPGCGVAVALLCDLRFKLANFCIPLRSRAIAISIFLARLRTEDLLRFNRSAISPSLKPCIANVRSKSSSADDHGMDTEFIFSPSAPNPRAPRRARQQIVASRRNKW